LRGALGAEASPLVVDLTQVAFIDSSGLATLIEALQAVGKYGGKLRLFGLTPEVRKLFDLAQLSTIFDLRDSRDDACAD
jgi:anti-sigma B factor antagonist